MHILVDLQGAQNGSRHRGIGRYTRALAQKICELALGRHRISLLLNGAFENVDDIRRLFAGYVHAKDIHVWYPFGDPSFRWVGNNLRRKASEYLREAVIHEIAADVLLVSSTVEGCDDATVVTIKKHFSATWTVTIFYDAIPAIYDNEYLADPRSREWYYEKTQELKRADLILAISESSKTEAIEYLAIQRSKVINISTAVSDDFCVDKRTIIKNDAVLERLSIGQHYILYSGASDARKNLPRLIEAFGLLPAQLSKKFRLVLAGGMPEQHTLDLKAAVRAAGLSETSVVFTGWVSDEELAAIYAHSTLFVFPSFHEGFGLPILEAMNYDLPVVAANSSSIPEVVELPEALFDPRDTRAIADKIELALTDQAFRQRLIVNSRRRRAAFSWEITARRALEAIEGLPSQPQRFPEPDVEARHVNHVLDQLGADAMLMPKEDIIGPIEKSLPYIPHPTQIFVDVSELHTRDSLTGIQRVVRNILANLNRALGPRHVVVPIATDLATGYRVSNKIGLRHIAGYVPVDNPLPKFRKGDIFLGLDFQDVLVPAQSAFFDDIRKAGVACYFIVYDMLPLKLCNRFPKQVARNYNDWINTVARCDGLIAISRSVADDIIAWMKETKLQLAAPVRVGHFKLGSNIRHETRKKADPGLIAWLKSCEESRIFATIGTLEPRKGHKQIIEAMNDLWKCDKHVSLVIVGKRGWDCKKLIETINNHPEKGARLLWLEEASDVDLLATLQSADALIAASEDEGFGLPIVEAQRFGLPVIARDIPVFREVAGNEGNYFTGFRGRDLAMCLSAWMAGNPDPRARSKKKPGLTWSESTEELVKIICQNNWYTTIF